MRKILNLSRNGFAAFKSAFRQVSLAAFGASLSVTLCCASNANAQTLSDYVTPAAVGSSPNAPISGGAIQYSSDTPADASYSVMSDSTKVEQAQYGQSLFGGVSNACANNVCAPGCDISVYVNYDALWLTRENNRYFSLSRNTYMPDFQFDFAGRYTVGRLLDCVNGWEASYVGPFDWQRQNAVLGAGNLQSRFVPAGGYTAAEVDTFNDANQHVQAWQAKLNSVELNRRWWTWDVVSTMIGVRYVDYQEKYLFLSDSARGVGVFGNNVNNRMVGAQIGADILYPVSLRANVGFRGKAGVYANFDEQATFLTNAGTPIFAAGQRTTDVAGLIELGVFTNYHIVPSVRLTAGYEMWYMPGVATVPGQDVRIVSPNTGFRVLNDDELFLHGGSVGLQILF